MAAVRLDSAGTMPQTPVEPSSSKRVLEPIERISEVLFGLIMVLTFTCSFSVAEAGRAEVRSLLFGALGCNLAWGVIDGIMYLMGCLAEKARALGTWRAVQTTIDPKKGQSVVARALPSVVASAMGPAELEGIRQLLQRLPEPPSHPRLDKSDWLGALAVFVLVVLSTCPVVLPFALMQNAMLAHRLSNAIAIGLLFSTGYAFGRCTGYHPHGMGVVMVAIGAVLVGLTILLGG
jgi:hypothetical protein